MAASGPAAAVRAGSVFVKDSGDASARFSKVDIFDDDTVADLAERATRVLEFNVAAKYVRLYLVPAALVNPIQRDPRREHEVLVEENLCLATDKLADAGVGIRSGCSLLARVTRQQAAAALGKWPSRAPCSACAA